MNLVIGRNPKVVYSLQRLSVYVTPRRLFYKTRIVSGNSVAYGGLGRVVGTVKDKASPSNLPRLRRVVLFVQPTGPTGRDALGGWTPFGSKVGEVFSDATTGAYTFNNLALDKKYVAVSFDHTDLYQAVISDNLVPERMP